jgi:PAS domain S-box-containing protein
MDRSAEGEEQRSLTVLIDVTERKHAEEALRESEARYARAVSGTNDGLWDWDILTGESYLAPRWEEIVGHEPGELEPTHQTFVELTHPDDRKRMLGATRAHLEERVPYDMEVRLRHKSGEYIWVRTRGQAIWDADGEPLRMAGSLTDITQSKRSEEQIRKLNEHLEERVEERTAELRAAQDSLLRKERLATLGQLTGTVAHELRNPLGTIANSINVIRHKIAADGPDLERSLDRAERNIKRCDNIITELLDFARAKGLQAEPTVVDTWLVRVLEEQQIPKAVTVTCDFGADATTVTFDRDELRRAVINLVDNACQAMIDAETPGPGAIWFYRPA